MKTRLQITTLARIVVIATASVLNVKAADHEAPAALEFSSVVWGTLSLSELYYPMGETFVPLDISLRKRSKIQALEKSEFFELYLRKESTAGEVSYELVGQTALVPNAKRLLFFIEEGDEAAELPLQLRAFNDSLEVFPAGTFRMCNDTSETLQLVLNGVTIELKAGAVELIKTGVSKDGGFLPFSILDSVGNPVMETRVLCQAGERKMIIIHPPLKSQGSLVVNFLTEFIPTPSR